MLGRGLLVRADCVCPRSRRWKRFYAFHFELKTASGKLTRL